jgi:hypothetical protein
MTTGVDPAERATRFARAVSEGLNCLSVFLCAPGLRKFRDQAPDLLHRWEAEYAPVFREIGIPDRRGAPAALSAGLAKISSLVAVGVNLDAPDQLFSLRSAIRDVFAAMGVPTPVIPASAAAVCELHGEACPFLADDARA